LTAFAVLILAVSVLAIGVVSRDGTIGAATGTIDVLNVGTCYTTNDDVFDVGACDDGTGTEGYNVTGRDSVSEVGMVYATYSHDPKTAADNPRGILRNSDLIKISIQDTGRDKRTPVLLPVGNVDPGQLSDDDFEVIKKVFKDVIRPADRPDDMYWGEDDTHQSGVAVRTHVDLETGIKDGLTVLAGSDVEYLPMYKEDDKSIRFFGWVDENDDNSQDTSEDSDEKFKELSRELKPDEDRGTGRTPDEDGGAVAPWLNIQVHNANAKLQYIVYYTSERESLIGGKSDETIGTAEIDGIAVNPPEFTKSEQDSNSSLTVRARSDGDASTQNLWLKETGRFTGVYEGYLRLTDADGHGTGNTRSNWGLKTDDAMSSTMEDAAVLGVESGPVVIEYRDTDGDTQTLTIAIDTVPPTVQIDSPAHESRARDTSPEFAGSYNDGESGLRQESFRLYIDNTNDPNENGDSGTSVLDLNVVSTDMDSPCQPHGCVDKPVGVVRSIEDYEGYGDSADDRQFGVFDHTKVYLQEEEEKRLHIGGDRYSDGANNGTFSDSVRIRIKEGSPLEEIDSYNNAIDFQALVTDVAGNIGFSDSDDAGPRFINDYGKEEGERKTGRYNVLGWYARHFFNLDEKDPEIYQEQSVTGFYGIDKDDKPVVSRSGILIAFDAAVDADSVDEGTFEVKLDPADAQDTSPPSATVTDVTVEGRQVYLMLSEELASDATPSVRIATGKSVLDPAGNRLTRGGMDALEVNDGIAPQLTVTLSGGSGTGEGNEASDKLTNEAMTIAIASDEPISGTPSITVVCSNIAWDSDDDDKKNDKGLSDFTAARSGALMKDSAAFDTPSEYGCGGDDAKNDISPQQVQAFSRPGLEWEYQWQNFSGDKELKDGKLTVVAYGRDRQSYASLTDRRIGDPPASKDSYSWGVGTAEFTFDQTEPVLTSTPGDGDTVTDQRPFVLLDYADESTVTVSKLTIDESDQTELVQVLGAKRFLYWPESLSIGTHDVVIEAVDAAGNKTSPADKYSFKVAERGTFNIKLIAGWNAVSLPANPIDPAVASVFTEPTVDMVAAWNGEMPEAPWSIATRMDGEWSTHSDFATLNKITARYGYWVHAQGFVTQPVALVGKINRESPDVVPPDLVEIPTNPGWNFVGVIDQDGDQTQNDYGEVLKTGDSEVMADSYLGKHARAYRWDAIRSRFDIVSGDDKMKIGDGIWVYFPGDGIAP
jgi:hypothetical protein